MWPWRLPASLGLPKSSRHHKPGEKLYPLTLTLNHLPCSLVENHRWGPQSPDHCLRIPPNQIKIKIIAKQSSIDFLFLGIYIAHRRILGKVRKIAKNYLYHYIFKYLKICDASWPIITLNYWRVLAYDYIYRTIQRTSNLQAHYSSLRYYKWSIIKVNHCFIELACNKKPHRNVESLI